MMDLQLRIPAVYTQVLCGVLFFTAICGPTNGVAQETTEHFDSLVAEWRVAPIGSSEEGAIEDSIQSLVERLLGDEAVDAYGRYLRADVGSQEEEDALEEAQGAAAGAVRWPRAVELLMAYWSLAGDGAGTEPSVMDQTRVYMESSEVEIVLESTQIMPSAGGRFGVLGTITNRLEEPVWIVNAFTTLLPPPEIWGSGRVSSMGAFFPSVPAVPTGEVVRIDGGGSYVVMWFVQPRRSGDDPPGTRRVPLVDFLQFRPGAYRFTALVHTWTRPPVLEAGRVTNLGDSEIARGEARIEIGLPIIILLVGAVIGGLTAFAIRLVGLLKTGRRPHTMGWLTFLLVGGLGAVFVAAIGTVLISRLGQLDSFISLSINDLWGAMASGFLLEWLGLRPLLESHGVSPKSQPS